jgi:hypothetical protein
MSDAGDMGSTQARDGCSGLKNGLRQGHNLSMEGSRPLRKQLRWQPWALDKRLARGTSANTRSCRLSRAEGATGNAPAVFKAVPVVADLHQARSCRHAMRRRVAQDQFARKVYQ